MLRFLTAGESHGRALVVIVEGLPAGLAVTAEALAKALARRRLGHGRGARMNIEQDELEIYAGVRDGTTTGAPVAVIVGNTEWEQWRAIMDPAPAGARGKERTAPRPGHADLAGMLKYDTHDARDVLERASARETAARTVVGVLAAKLLAVADISVMSHVTAIGDVVAPGGVPAPDEGDVIDASPVRCRDAAASTEMVAAIDAAAEAKETLGGVFEVVAHGVPPGLGSYVHHDRRLDAELAAALMSIPAVKGVEVGDGFAVAGLPGSLAHDEIGFTDGRFTRATARAGGVEGGTSNGEPIIVRAAMKPLSTLMQPLGTVDVVTKEVRQAFRERSDVCAVPAAAVVGEAVVAIALAREAQRKFGGDTVGDFTAAVDAYRKRLAVF